MAKSRPLLICGNWKMHKTIQEGKEFVETLASELSSSQATVALAVPFTSLAAIASLVKEKRYPIQIGAQNMHSEIQGAFTGEISVGMLKEAGATFVLLGHSERRRIFQESSAFIQKKVKRALEFQLKPILCIGETLEERKRGDMRKILSEQIVESLEGISVEEMKQLTLAYEPVWAIGTGIVAKPEEAEEAHLFCRGVVEKKWGKQIADSLLIQYGGSVQPENAKALLEKPNIDGLLVGGASLKVLAFAQIINSYP